MLSTVEILEKWETLGKAKAESKILKLFILGIFAGAFIAFAGVASTLAGYGTEAKGLSKLLGAMVFPGGLAMVLIAGGELFTGNTLILIPLAGGKVGVGSMLKNWVTVYIGNFVGAFLVAAAAVYGGTLNLFGDGLTEAVVATAASKAALGFSDALIRGILCNFLVCIAVWIASGATSAAGKVIGLFFPIMIFVLCGYEHSVANMYYIPAGLLASARYGIESTLTVGGLFANLIPVTLGNILGGGVIVGLGYALAYRKRA